MTCLFFQHRVLKLNTRALAYFWNTLCPPVKIILIYCGADYGLWVQEEKVITAYTCSVRF